MDQARAVGGRSTGKQGKMKKKIIIDPGHGKDRQGRWKRPLMCLTPDGRILRGKRRVEGARYYREDLGTLEIANGAREALGTLNYRPILTRTDQYASNLYLGGLYPDFKSFGPIKATKELMRAKKADCLVSIHTNAGGGTGIACFWDGPNGEHLAEALAEDVAFEMDLSIRKIKKNKKYGVLKKLGEVDRCLIECGFHDNPRDLAVLTEPGKLHQIGLAIGHAVAKHFETLGEDQ